MPLPILAHQAPVLPLKLWRPLAFNGTALVIGSIAPDLEYLPIFFDSHAAKGFAHSIAGQLLFCLPLTLAVVGLIGRLGLGEVLVARLGARFTWLVGAATDVVRPGGLGRAAVSALIGSFSHIALDALTHTILPGGLPEKTHRVGRLLFSTPTIIQLVVSGVGGGLSLWLLYRISQRPTTLPPTPRPGRSFVATLALLGATMGVLGAWPAIRHPESYFYAAKLYVWGFVAFFAACGAGLGVLLAGMILRAWDRRAVRL